MRRQYNSIAVLQLTWTCICLIRRRFTSTHFCIAYNCAAQKIRFAFGLNTALEAAGIGIPIIPTSSGHDIFWENIWHFRLYSYYNRSSVARSILFICQLLLWLQKRSNLQLLDPLDKVKKITRGNRCYHICICIQLMA